MSASRRLPLLSIACALLSCLPAPASAAPAANAPIVKQTFTYKKEGDLEIKLDVYRADDALPRKVAVWIHGGALINGGRQGVSGRVKKDMLGAGYALVSLDYRLAPETKLPQIVSDLEDAFKWIRREGPKQFNADVSRIAVLGGSAGGCLTLTAGFRAQPPPDVLVAFWGYGDFLGPWLSEPSPHERHRRAGMTKAEAAEVAGGPPVANSADRKGNGAAFYQYCRRNGLWPDHVGGFDPRREATKFHPFMAVRNISNQYPPTLLIHGTEDTDVPHEQSVMMATEFRRHGVEHRLISVQRGEHGLAGADRNDVEAAYAAVLPFVRKHMDE